MLAWLIWLKIETSDRLLIMCECGLEGIPVSKAICAWADLENTVANIWVPQKMRNVLSSWATICFWRTVLHAASIHVGIKFSWIRLKCVLMKTQIFTCLCEKHITRVSVYFSQDCNIRWSGHINFGNFVVDTRIVPESVGWESEQKLWTLSYSRSIWTLSFCHWHRNVCRWHGVWSIHIEQGGKPLPKIAS